VHGSHERLHPYCSAFSPATSVAIAPIFLHTEVDVAERTIQDIIAGQTLLTAPGSMTVAEAARQM